MHRLGVSLKELHESRFWVRFTLKAKVQKGDNEALFREADELCRIIASSIVTAKANAKGHG
jgi:hypothetical protein